MKVWSQLHERYVRRYYPIADDEVLAEKLGRTVYSVKGRANKLGLVKILAKGRFKKFSAIEKRYLSMWYPRGNLQVMADRLGVPLKIIWQRANAWGLKRDESFVLENNRVLGKVMAEKGLGKRFVKGSVSHNKGKKLSEFMSPEAIERCKAGQFKVGQDPHNTRPIGWERITLDGYTEVKVRHSDNSKDNFELKHRMVWAENFGPIPEGMVVEFIDNNKRNFEPTNLRIVTRIQNVRNNALKDTAIVKRVFKERDPNVVQEIIDNHSDIIEMKRNSMRVDWKLRELKKKQNGA
jgi:hypothetical protein